MYNLNQIRKVGLIHCGAGFVIVLAGILGEAFSSNNWTGAFIGNLTTFVLFGGGWFLFNQIAMGTTFGNLRKGQNFNNLPFERLKTPEQAPRRFKLDYWAFELIAMVLAVVLVALLALAIGNSGGFSLGGFAGGWLLGGGLGRLRFTGKARQQEREQERIFYFSDSSLSPRTVIAFYEEKPGKRTLEETSRPANAVSPTVGAALPPGVRRRAGSSVSTPASPVRKRARTSPIKSATPENLSPSTTPSNPKPPAEKL